MAHSVTLMNAKTHISTLLDKVEAGEEVTITRDGKPIALIVPAPAGVVQRQAGDWGWAPGAYDPDISKPATEEEMRKEGWSWFFRRRPALLSHTTATREQA